MGHGGDFLTVGVSSVSPQWVVGNLIPRPPSPWGGQGTANNSPPDNRRRGGEEGTGKGNRGVEMLFREVIKRILAEDQQIFSETSFQQLLLSR